MTTEFMSVPPTWTAEETLRLIQRVGGAKETVYEVELLAEWRLAERPGAFQSWLIKGGTFRRRAAAGVVQQSRDPELL